MSSQAASSPRKPPQSADALKEALKRQVEFYFSRANLANDAFLVSQMNSQMFVPIDVILQFAKIKQLTEDPKVLVQAVRDSSVCSLNEVEDAIKPCIKSERNTIILREIPSGTKPEDVEAIFEGCTGTVASVRSDVGDTWFVTMQSEEEAVQTLLELRNKTFNGSAIKARLKSENLLKSFYAPQNASDAGAGASNASRSGGGYEIPGYYGGGVATSSGAAARGYYDNYGVQYAGMNPRGNQYAGGMENNRFAMNQRGGAGMSGRGAVAGHQPHYRHAGGRGAVAGGGHFHGPNAGHYHHPQAKETRAKGASLEQQPQQSQQPHQGQQQPRPASRKNKDKRAGATTKQGAGPLQHPQQQQPSPQHPHHQAHGASNGPNSVGKHGKHHASTTSGSTAATGQQPILNAANFPPLPTNADKALEHTPIKYQYAHEDIMEIVKNMDEKDCELPAGKMDFDIHSSALTPIANADLLRNQRTYSIEQAREALRQGRPIRSDSIGSVDYESMMYGEEYTKEARELRKQKADAEAAAAVASVAKVTKKAPAPASSKSTTTHAAPVKTEPKKTEDKVSPKNKSTPAAPRVIAGYAAAVINGTPAPAPTATTPKQQATASGDENASTTPSNKKKNGKSKATKAGHGKDDKKPHKGAKHDTQSANPPIDEPKAGVWGERNFLDVVKSQPEVPPTAAAAVNKVPSPVANKENSKAAALAPTARSFGEHRMAAVTTK